MEQRGTNLFQLSLTMALWTNIAYALLTQSWSPLVQLSRANQRLATAILLILPTAIGIVLGVMSLKRKEWKPGWAISAIGLNILMLFVGILHLIF
jgi:hypothetical protein